MEEVQIILHRDENLSTPTVEAVKNHSNVDTSRPFRSVKEAVAILGERFSVGSTHSQNSFSLPKKEMQFYSPDPVANKELIFSENSSPSPNVSSCNRDTDTLKRLETELEATKAELKLLKKRGSETEVALASLNAELHRNMSKLARAEAVEAGKAADALGPASGEIKKGDSIGRIGSRSSSSTTSTTPILAKVLSIGDEEKLFIGREKERKWMKKKKPIIPLLGDLFSKKKESSTALHNPLFASSPFHFN